MRKNGFLEVALVGKTRKITQHSREGTMTDKWDMKNIPGIFIFLGFQKKG